MDGDWGSQRMDGGIERGKRGPQRMEGKEGILKDGWEVIEDPKGWIGNRVGK